MKDVGVEHWLEQREAPARYPRVSREFLQGFIDEEQGVVVAGHGHVHLVGVNALEAVTVLASPSFAGAVDQNAPHSLGGRSEKVSATIPLRTARFCGTIGQKPCSEIHRAYAPI